MNRLTKYLIYLLVVSFACTIIYLIAFCQFPAPSIKGEPYRIKTEVK